MHSQRGKLLECGVEQLVARWAHNPKATGSSPVPATKNRKPVERLAFCISRNTRASHGRLDEVTATAERYDAAATQLVEQQTAIQPKLFLINQTTAFFLNTRTWGGE